MKKNERLIATAAGLAGEPGGEHSPWYGAYFACFNAGQYYEAHDVLEQLWLSCRDENALFYKGLIQVAGAFVHFQKQFLLRFRPKDRPRLRPAGRVLLTVVGDR